ncbi:MAG TPA: SPOR domain-containing protein [Bacillota bacterium]|nr:SPOR domain-containing protein [Bacillota bacterium]
MKNNYFSKDDDMQPFIVKKMNLPPSSSNKKEEGQDLDHESSTSTTMHNRNRVIEEHVYEIPSKRKKGTFKVAKPLLLSVVSAVVIGVLLGFIVLKMSSGGADVASENHPSQPASQGVEAASKSENEDQESQRMIQLNELKAYVLQAGVYSEKENTEEVVSTFQSQGYPATIWEEENQYYVFTHIFTTEEQAKDAVNQLEKNELEVYAKPWTTKEKSIEMTEEEEAFIQSFVQTWEETVDKHASGETNFIQLWEQLATDMPTDSGNIDGLVTYITKEISEAEVAIDMEQILLDTWYMYSKLGES